MILLRDKRFSQPIAFLAVFLVALLGVAVPYNGALAAGTYHSAGKDKYYQMIDSKGNVDSYGTFCITSDKAHPDGNASYTRRQSQDIDVAFSNTNLGSGKPNAREYIKRTLYWFDQYKDKPWELGVNSLNLQTAVEYLIKYYLAPNSNDTSNDGNYWYSRGGKSGSPWSSAHDKFLSNESGKPNSGDLLAKPIPEGVTAEYYVYVPTDGGKYQNMVGAKFNYGPQLATDATGTDDKTKELPATGGGINDAVEITNATVGKQYTLQGELLEVVGNGAQATAKSLDPAVFSNTVTFTATSKTEHQKVTFADIGDKYPGKTLVVYQRLYEGDTAAGKPVATEEKPAEARQQVTVKPKITTVATTDNANDNDKVSEEGGIITDAVTYTGLEANKSYMLTGTLMVKGKNDTNATPLPVNEYSNVDDNGNSVNPARILQAGGYTGTWNVKFKIPKETAEKYPGQDIIVYEVLKSADGVTPLAEEQRNIEEQTVHVQIPAPGITTEASKQGVPTDKTLPFVGGTIEDAIKYQHLKKNTQYVLFGEIHKKKHDDPNYDNRVPTGIVANGPVSFRTDNPTVTYPDGSVTGTVSGKMSFVIPNDEQYYGWDLIVVERLYEVPASGVIPATEPNHATAVATDELTRASLEHQTVYVYPKPTPKIQTLLAVGDTQRGDNDPVPTLPITGGELHDTVKFTGLLPNTPYTVYGKLKRKTGANSVEDMQIEAKDVVHFTTGNATEPDGSVSGIVPSTLDFTVPNGAVQPAQMLVAYESLYAESPNKTEIVAGTAKKLVAEEKADNPPQSVNVGKPRLETKATDKLDGNKSIAKSKPSTIVDTVKYFKLAPNTQYTLIGEVYGDGNSSNKLATKKLVFSTPEANDANEPGTAQGIQEMEFQLQNSGGYNSLTVYEYLYSGDVGNADGTFAGARPVAIVTHPDDQSTEEERQNQTVTANDEPAVGTGALIRNNKTNDNDERVIYADEIGKNGVDLNDVIYYQNLPMNVGDNYKNNGYKIQSELHVMNGDQEVQLDPRIWDIHARNVIGHKPNEGDVFLLKNNDYKNLDSSGTGVTDFSKASTWQESTSGDGRRYFHISEKTAKQYADAGYKVVMLEKFQFHGSDWLDFDISGWHNSVRKKIEHWDKLDAKQTIAFKRTRTPELKTIASGAVDADGNAVVTSPQDKIIKVPGHIYDKVIYGEPNLDNPNDIKDRLKLDTAYTVVGELWNDTKGASTGIRAFKNIEANAPRTGDVTLDFGEIPANLGGDTIVVHEYLFDNTKGKLTPGYRVDTNNLAGVKFEEAISREVTGNKNQTVTVEKKESSFAVEVIKVDADNKQRPLSGAEFALYKANGENLGDQITTVSKVNGNFHFDNLQLGTYYLVETKAPGEEQNAPGKHLQLLPAPLKVEIVADATGKPKLKDPVKGDAAYGLLDQQGDAIGTPPVLTLRVADLSIGDMPKAGDIGLIPIMLLAGLFVIGGVYVARRTMRK